MKKAHGRRALAVLTAVTAAGLCASSLAAAAAPRRSPPVKKASVTTAPAQAPHTPQLRVLDHAETFLVDYQAEVYSGVPLTDPYAKERGLERGLVWLALSDERQLTFRVPKEKLKRLTRLAMDDEPRTPPGFALAAARSPMPVIFGETVADGRGFPRDHIDVLDTTDGTVAVMTSTSNAGIFTSSDVFLFPKGKSESELMKVAHITDVARTRLREALALARGGR